MITKQFKFENGDHVRELVTGFTGTITGTVFYLTGCNQYLVTALPKDAFSEPAALWYDEGRLTFLGKVCSAEDVSGAAPGCDKTQQPAYAALNQLITYFYDFRRITTNLSRAKHTNFQH